MKRKSLPKLWEYKRYLSFLALALLFSGVGCNLKNHPATVKVATAANMQFAMEEIVAAFEKENEAKVEIILSSSGKLTAQIQSGAPYDVFVSADTKYPDALAKNGFAAEGPIVYASGKLVLWTTTLDTISLEEILSDQVKKLAIPNPKTAPYGEAAYQFLQKVGWLEMVEKKMVMGESVSQTNQFITTGAAQAGFTAYSVALSPAWRSKGSFVLIDSNQYQHIDQSMILLKPMAKSQKPIAAQAKSFFNFMQSDQAKAILKKYGYATYE